MDYVVLTKIVKSRRNNIKIYHRKNTVNDPLKAWGIYQIYLIC